MKKTYRSIHKALEFFDLLGAGYQSSSTLASKLGVDPRTVQAYAAVFREFGWGVESSHAKGYRLCSSGLEARLTERELVLLAVLLAQGSSILPPHDFDKLARKITQLLPRDSQDRIEGLNEKLYARTHALRDLETLAAVGRCLSDPHFQIVMDYRKTPEAEVERRNILPLSLRYQDDWYYVDSFDLDKKGVRSYRLDRFVRAQLLKQAKPISRPVQSVTETHKWDFGGGEPVAIIVRVRPELGAWLEETPAHPSQTIDKTETLWTLSYKARRLDMMVDWFMGLRGAEAVAPDEFRIRVRKRAKQLYDCCGTLDVAWE